MDGLGNFHNLTSHVSLALEEELKVIEMIKEITDLDGFHQNMLLEFLMMFQSWDTE